MKNETNVTPKDIARSNGEGEQPFSVRPDGSVLLIRPRLELQGDLFQNRRDVRTQKRIWEPSRAIIVNGLVIIEEWKCFVPLSYVSVGRWDDAPAKPEAS